MPPKMRCAARNASRPISETLTNSPISTNSGTLANTYSEIVPSAASASVLVAMPKSCLRNARPRKPVASSENAIGKPSTISASVSTIIATPTMRGSISPPQSKPSSAASSSNATGTSHRARSAALRSDSRAPRNNCRSNSAPAATTPASTTSLIGQTGILKRPFRARELLGAPRAQEVGCLADRRSKRTARHRLRSETVANPSRAPDG